MKNHIQYSLINFSGDIASRGSGTCTMLQNIHPGVAWILQSRQPIWEDLAQVVAEPHADWLSSCASAACLEIICREVMRLVLMTGWKESAMRTSWGLLQLCTGICIYMSATGQQHVAFILTQCYNHLCRATWVQLTEQALTLVSYQSPPHIKGMTPPDILQDTWTIALKDPDHTILPWPKCNGLNRLTTPIYPTVSFFAKVIAQSGLQKFSHKRSFWSSKVFHHQTIQSLI